MPALAGWREGSGRERGGGIRTISERDPSTGEPSERSDDDTLLRDHENSSSAILRQDAPHYSRPRTSGTGKGRSFAQLRRRATDRCRWDASQAPLTAPGTISIPAVAPPQHTVHAIRNNFGAGVLLALAQMSPGSADCRRSQRSSVWHAGRRGASVCVFANCLHDGARACAWPLLAPWSLRQQLVLLLLLLA